MKRILILILTLLSFKSKSQDCSKLWKNVTDRFTQENTSQLVYPIKRILKNGAVPFYMDIHDTNNGYMYLIFELKNVGFGCISPDNKIEFLFRDSTTLTLYNRGTSCNGTVLGALREGHTDYQEPEADLSTKVIKAIRINGDNTSYEIDLNPLEAEKFRKSASCLINR